MYGHPIVKKYGLVLCKYAYFCFTVQYLTTLAAKYSCKVVLL